MTPLRKATVLVMLAMGLPLFAQTTTPAAPAATAAPPVVVRWQPGGETLMNKQDQMKVLRASEVTIAVTMVHLSKQTTAARIQIANASPETLNTSADAFSVEVVKPKPQTIAAIPADKMAAQIRGRADADAQRLERDTGSVYRESREGGALNQKERQEMRSKGAEDAWYVEKTAFPASMQPNGQAIGHIFFPYVKADDVVLRITMGGMIFEFPFNKKEIRNDFGQ